MFDGENSSMAIIRIMASLKALIPKGMATITIMQKRYQRQPEPLMN